MRYRDVLAMLLPFPADRAALSVAQTIAAEMRASLSALLIEVKRPPLYPLEGVMTALAFDEVLEAEHKQFEAALADLKAHASKASRPIDVGSVSAIPDLLAATLGACARYADLAVMLRPRL